MKPRIFVSSTFYDLKYIREDLSNFIKAHDFEPIMFEDGDIGYTPGKPLDGSCYEAMNSADMVLLIIGGNYGSPATGQVKDEFKEYMSVTRNEFKKAVSTGTPLYAFVDNKVYAEYEVYEENYDKIEVEKEIIKFRNTKDINVFRFIRDIRDIGHISITEFDKVTQIKDFLSKQWSDMFKIYLDYLKEKESDKKVEGTVDEMKTLIKKMNVMLDGVGKKILSTDDSKEYKKVVELQKIIQLASEISGSFGLVEVQKKDSEEQRRIIVEKFLLALHEASEKGVLSKIRSKDLFDRYNTFKFFKEKGIELDNISFNADKSIEELSNVYINKEARELLIDEIIKDENYYNFLAIGNLSINLEQKKESYN
ncbi:MAG: DUF4062 domain-containing protein [Paenibacillaceae bacterium]|nr:DUF4062 domain-containing protein [Paenibacillaceae bacterium]